MREENRDKFKETVRIYNKFRKSKNFIAEKPFNKIFSFLKFMSKDSALGWLFYLALAVEINNIEAKRQLLKQKPNDWKSKKHYRRKHIILKELITWTKEWNVARPDQMILYGHAFDESNNMETVLFNLPNTEQISWHDNSVQNTLPEYPLEWDGQINSTLLKIRQGIINNFSEELKAWLSTSNSNAEELETSDVECPFTDELFDNVVAESKTHSVWIQRNYMHRMFCKEGAIRAMQLIRKNQKEATDNIKRAPDFLMRLIQIEYDRIENITNGESKSTSENVNELIKTFSNGIQKKRFKSAEVRVKKVRNIFGKYLVTFDATMPNDAHVVYSLYSKETPFTKEHPEWLKRYKDAELIFPEENVRNLETAAMSYIGQYL